VQCISARASVDDVLVMPFHGYPSDNLADCAKK